METQNHFSNEDEEMLPNFGIELPNFYFNPSWNNSADQGDPFESALSSMVSSPAATAAGDGMVLRELIGRLGSICSSGEIELSPHSYNINSTNTSCYSTPLNSPPRINGNFQVIPSDPALAALSANPGFAERAARYSRLGARKGDHSEHLNRKLSRCSSPDNGYEGSSVSEQIPNGNAKKRKSVLKGKGKVTALPSPAKTDPKVSGESDELSAKKRKPNEEGNEKKKKSGSKAPQAEPPKDYIHVRARRGEATDSHSIAERARREKISERMKFLQDLVPGCNKIIGKAVMLDEIINYVQSLQRQVEFLSMKLATVNPLIQFNPEVLLSKDVFQSRRSVPQNIYPSDTAFPYGYQSSQVPFSMPPLNPLLHHSTSMHLPPIDGFAEAPPQASAFWEDDLRSVVQMGFGQIQLQNLQKGAGQMKLEL